MTYRAHARLDAVARASAQRPRAFNRPLGTNGQPQKVSEFFGSNTFGFDLMEKMLPADDVKLLREGATSRRRLTTELADKVAVAVKEWATSKGATHYCHWFQPLTGSTAEKHDSFFSFDETGGVLEKFTGKELIQAEPDASSFPSGGVRETFEARGYTAWDASSPMFLMEIENGITLCIPSVFISYSGEALDQKTPLLRSIQTISDKATKALSLLGDTKAEYVTSTAGPEQEYFVVDEAFYALRPDLVQCGRTLVGRIPPKHQQLDDHYFGAIKPRALNFIMECEHELYKLGVPCKTRHNEVAPAQYETAPIFEMANVASDHNQLVMAVIRKVANRHGLHALFHEKPYANINGSGKHLNWSLATSQGQNLLEPGENPQDNVRFLYFLTAVVKAIHDNGALLRMSVASPGNDFRLGANEAPPAIMSVFLGETLNEVLSRLAGNGGPVTERPTEINLDLARVPVINRDNTDRNRTSPFAFTGNKFEFRALGSSQSISLPLTFLNAAVARSLDEMNGRLEKSAGGKTATNEQVLALVAEVVKETDRVRFEGDNYDTAWHAEAEKRGLPNLRTTPEALRVLKRDTEQKMLDELGILTRAESDARFNVQVEHYNKIRTIELESLLDVVNSHVLPAALQEQRAAAESIDAASEFGSVPKSMTEAMKAFSKKLGGFIDSRNKLDTFLHECRAIDDELKLADRIADEGMAIMEHLKAQSNELEGQIDDSQWSLPKLREMLYHL